MGAFQNSDGEPCTCELVVIVSTLATKMVFPLRRTMPSASACRERHVRVCTHRCSCATRDLSSSRWDGCDAVRAAWQAHGSNGQTLISGTCPEAKPF